MESNIAPHQPPANAPQQPAAQGVTLTDTLIESLKPALVFKNFVSHYLEPLILSLVERNQLYRHLARRKIPRGGM